VKPSEILKRAKERISTPEKWTRDASFRDATGKALLWLRTSEAPPAQCCMLGAVWLDNDTSNHRAATDELDAVCGTFSDVATFNHASYANDALLTHEGVMWVYDLAIARLEARGQ
jgi:hypothetical protein